MLFRKVTRYICASRLFPPAIYQHVDITTTTTYTFQILLAKTRNLKHTQRHHIYIYIYMECTLTYTHCARSAKNLYSWYVIAITFSTQPITRSNVRVCCARRVPTRELLKRIYVSSSVSHYFVCKSIIYYATCVLYYI